MKFSSRLKKLEEQKRVGHGIWATFSMRHYEEPEERARVKQQLLDTYLAEGNPSPVGCIYWNEICSECGSEDEFMGSYPANPLAVIMQRIAESAQDPLDHADK